MNTSKPTISSDAPSRPLVIAAFLIVYVIWGSTYLGIRLAIESIPPLFMAGTRYLVVLYAFNDWDGRLDVPLWSLVNEGVNLPLQNPVAVMQTDGNFVVYAEYPTYPGNFYAAWNTQTYGRDGQGVFLRCQDDGNLGVYLPDGQALWWSNTYAGLH